MLKADLHPPRDGLDADPVLFGVAAALAQLFPPIRSQKQGSPEYGTERDVERDRREED